MCYTSLHSSSCTDLFGIASEPTDGSGNINYSKLYPDMEPKERLLNSVLFCHWEFSSDLHFICWNCPNLASVKDLILVLERSNVRVLEGQMGRDEI